MRILVVEDHDDLRELLRLQLLEEGADATAVPTAEEALALYEVRPYDAIVSDLKLPGKDGCALLTMVRGMEQGRDRPAVAVAYSGEPPTEATRALRHGFNHFVSKPQLDRLLALLGHVAATLRSE